MPDNTVPAANSSFLRAPGTSSPPAGAAPAEPSVDDRIEAQLAGLGTGVLALLTRAHHLETQAGTVPSAGTGLGDVRAVLDRRHTLGLLRQAQQARESAASQYLLIRPATAVAELIDDLIRTSGTRRRHSFLHLPLWAHQRCVRLRSAVFEVGTVRVGCQQVKGVADDEIRATGRDSSRVLQHRIIPNGLTAPQAAIYGELRAGGQDILAAYDAARS